MKLVFPELALRHYTEVIEMAPNFAEGYNKRATVGYLLRDFPRAIEDCKATLALNPNHFGALSGMGLCHLGRAAQPALICRQGLTTIQ